MMSRDTKGSFLERTSLLFDEEALGKLADSRIVVMGLGGVGGIIAVTLARMGVGHLRIADPGVFDPPDINRQYAAVHGRVGCKKAEVYAELLEDINPDLELSVYPDGVTEENYVEMTRDVDFVVEAMDIMTVDGAFRRKVAAEVRSNGAYIMLPVIMGFATAVPVSSPDGMALDPFLDLVDAARERGGLPTALGGVMNPHVLSAMSQHMARGTIPSLACATGLVAAVAVTEIVMALVPPSVPWRREPVVLPRLILADTSVPVLREVDIRDFAAGGGGGR